MIEFHSQNKEKITIVSIALEKSKASIETFRKSFNFPWKHQIIEQSSFVMLSDIAQLYGVTEIPYKVLISPKGEIMDATRLAEIQVILNQSN